MDVRRRVGLNVKRLRQEKGWSQEALAFEAKLHRTYVSGVERGVRNPTVTVLEVIAAALGLPSSRLLDEVVEPPAQKKR
ncbi:helix-turn-helix domain-containing protein [Hansschlegelia quercus]|uniref:XRE family transcriptional regulator n=1 Tax=Hansschlegelia quercus TaxID=2528245 RepID=A0A4Q9GNS9_9HYPH|nr:helix-turn-helix transcriptional regulator [Hansschlegelia quercus]TBN53510.1 XRE family transcriptional regulator [Hansschlegelia quercus]